MTDENKVDVIVVGAGPAGLACAWVAASAGLQVLVLERGDAAGTKNVSGGRLYLEAVRALEPDLLEGLPLERSVTRESICLMTADASTTVSWRGDRAAVDPPHSATVLRGPLDAHLAERCGEKGAFVIPSTPVRELVMDGSKVTGVVAGGETFAADVVVLADGALSFLGQQAGLHAGVDGSQFAVGVKEVLALDRGRIEDRFNLEGDQGEARLFMGDVTRGKMGGGFVYTNRESLSLGVVAGLHSYREGHDCARTSELMEAFKDRPEIRPLVRDATLVEYSAHVVPEGGLDAAPKRIGDGVLAVGDAAGLALNHGLTVRGMDLALASGVLAGRAIVEAREAEDFSATGLAGYDVMIDQGFVGQDLHTFRAASSVLARERWYEVYPAAVCDMLGELFWFGDGPKEKLFSTAWKHISRDFLTLDGLRDGWEARRL
jgi:electron transfer flavoprotein-quinone oxidoreductase